MTIAVHSPDTVEASFWQVYQVSPNVYQKRLPAGRWSLSTSKNKLNQTRNENPEESKEKERIEFAIEVNENQQSSTEMVERDVTFGKLIALAGDPFLRRTDLTGLHLSCTTVVVRSNMKEKKHIVYSV